jgi:glycosyltransferase involved in cell wall biosynthesis
MEEQIFTITKAFKDRGGFFLPVFGDDLAPAVEERYRDAGLRVEGLNLHKVNLAGLKRLLGLIRSNRIDTLHWNFYSPINPYVWMISILAPGLKHYLTDHTSRQLPLAPPPSGIKKLLKKFLFKRYSRVWCISDFVVDCLKHTDTWSNLQRCTYFINTERFKPDPAVRVALREKYNAQDQFVVLFVAYIIRDKGGDVALKAIAQLPEFVHLWMVGDGPDVPRLRDLMIELGIEDRVHFLGSQKHVQPFMQAADVFICPSLWGEATGLVNLEAQASGLPLVASRIGGIPEFVNDGKAGFLFTPRDHEQLAAHLRMLAENPEMHRRFSDSARTFAEAEFSIERRLDDYVRAYD